MTLTQKIVLELSSVWWRLRNAADELIVLVDDNGTPIGIAPKLQAHNSETKLHLAFSVFVFNSRGELLLQQRAMTKKTWPGVWSNSCCGHLMLHETTEHAAARRLKKELGLIANDLTVILPNFRYRAEKDKVVENEICPVLVATCDSDPIPDASEVADFRWIDWREFVSSLDDPANEKSPWAVEESRLLTDSSLFRKWFAERIPA
ncbi:MAG: isopentenyl-diphosphate delta-isomerase [Acidobacteria bacterium]|nr:MAG: isopentenyl-diphosphate delta-isomerase [Acidobacteriota bacterium]